MGQASLHAELGAVMGCMCRGQWPGARTVKLGAGEHAAAGRARGRQLRAAPAGARARAHRARRVQPQAPAGRDAQLAAAPARRPLSPAAAHAALSRAGTECIRAEVWFSESRDRAGLGLPAERPRLKTSVWDAAPADRTRSARRRPDALAVQRPAAAASVGLNSCAGRRAQGPGTRTKYSEPCRLWGMKGAHGAPGSAPACKPERGTLQHSAACVAVPERTGEATANTLRACGPSCRLLSCRKARGSPGATSSTGTASPLAAPSWAGTLQAGGAAPAPGALPWWANEPPLL